MIRPGRVSSVLRLVLPAVWLVACAVPVAAKSYSADRFDVTARLLSDRSLTIEERITFRFEGGDYTYVFREIPQDRTDGVRDLQAEMDGVPFRTGAGPGSIELKQGRSVRVTWRFAPTSGRHTFTLRYRLAGVITQEAEENVLAWRVLPRTHEYRIGQARCDRGAAARCEPRGAALGKAGGGPRQCRLRTGRRAAERIVASANEAWEDDSISAEAPPVACRIHEHPPDLATRGTRTVAPRAVAAGRRRRRARSRPQLARVVFERVAPIGRPRAREVGARGRAATAAAAGGNCERGSPARPAGGPPFAATMVDLANRGVIAHR